MATYLPSSGAISINDINTLFGRGNDLNSYRGTTYYTSSAGPFTFSSGSIDMNSFHGAGPTANRASVSYTFSTNTANASLNVTTIGGYVAGSSDITITVNSGVYLYATSTGNAGLTLFGGTSGDTITLINNGYIMGQGGTGGNRSTNATAGGDALSLGFATTVNNTNPSAYIGGGGGGGGNNWAGTTGVMQGGGGGAGGGSGGGGVASGGSGGAIGSNGTNGGTSGFEGGGGGGGRVFPSTTIAGPTRSGVTGGIAGNGGSGGGSGAIYLANAGSSVTGGSGGSAGATGGNGTSTLSTANSASGGGGGWGASGGNAFVRSGLNIRPPGAGGKAVALNGFSITWSSGNTTRVYGAVS